MTELNLDERSRAVTPVAPGMDTRLYPYQQAAAEQTMRGWRRNAILAHHPGAGKTPMALAMASLHVFMGDKLTIVCPPSICNQWATRVREWLNGEQAVVCRTPAQVKTHARATVAIIPDSMLHLVTEAPPEGRIVIVDECHRFKERASRRTRALFGGRHGDNRFPGMTTNSAAVYALTGTPVISSPADLYPMLRAMGFADARGSFEAFCDQYCPPYPKEIRTPRGLISELRYDRPANLPTLAHKLRMAFLIRPKREDYLDQLPPLRFEDFPLNVADTSDPVLLALKPEAVPDMPSIAELRRQVGMQKAYAARDAIQDMLDGGDRPVIFAWHRDVIDQIANGHNLACVHGGHSMEEREAAINCFAMGDYKGIVMSIAACGTGLDGLQRITDSVMFIEESFSPHENEQAVARVHRTGQVNPVRVLRLTSDTVVDRAIAHARTVKTANAEGTLQ